jgi:hypothetical protein
MEYLYDLVIAIIGAIIGSVSFLYIALRTWRPKIKISKLIAHGEDIADRNKKAYKFKFINCSKHPAYDVRIRVCSKTILPCGDGVYDTIRKDMQLKRDYLSHIPSFKNKKYSNSAPYAIVFQAPLDLEPILKDPNQTVEVQIILRHGLSGLSDVFFYEYSKLHEVKEGEFNFGRDLTVS